MKKSTIIIYVLVLVLAVFAGTFVQKNIDQNKTVTIVAEPQQAPIEKMGYPELASLVMLREFVDYPVYKKVILPKVEKLLAKENATKEDYAQFEKEVRQELSAQGIEVDKLVHEYLRKEPIKESFKDSWQKFTDDAAKMGKDVQKEMNNFMNELNKQFNSEEPKKETTNSNQNNQVVM